MIDYTVEVDTSPLATGLRQTGDPDEILDHKKTVSLPAGGEIDTADFGYSAELSSVSDFVWNDEDLDGIQDPDEQGLKDVTVMLYNSERNKIDETITDENGRYLFDDLTSGDYYITIIPPKGYRLSPADQSNTVFNGGEKDSDADPKTGQTSIFTLDPSQNDTTRDVGLFQLATLGDYVWRDKDEDGIQDPDEEGLKGITVTLYDENGEEVPRHKQMRTVSMSSLK